MKLDRGLLVLRAGLALLLLPLALGLVVVTYQDAVMTHMPARAAIADALLAGEVPAIHPYQSCGQPLAGNPNFGTFFPDTLLLLLLPPPAAFGLRFALAAGLAFVGARRWARAEGLGREASEIAGLAFVLGGPFLSAWRFYNAGIALALAPFVLAASRRALQAPPGRSRNRALAELALWAALEVLAGEPVIALLTGLVVVARALGPDLPGRAMRLLVAAGLAALLAAPQIAATLQTYPASTRSRAPFSYAVATSTSVHPARVLELVNPYPFGRPDLTGERGFRGHARFDGHSPYLWTLHLGWPTLLLLVLFGRPLEPGERRFWLLAAGAAVLSLGYYLPLARVLYPALSLGGRVRFPVKWWYVVALALVPIVARAVQRAMNEVRPSALRTGLGAALVLAGVGLIPFTDARTGLVRAGLVVSVLSAIALLANIRLARAPAGVLAWTLALPLGLAAAPLVNAFVDRPPPAPPALGAGRLVERIAATDPHPADLAHAPAESRTRDVFRRATPELWAVSGGRAGIQYAFDADPDGSYLDFDRVMRKGLDDRPWPERLNALRAAGVAWVASDETLPPPYRGTASLGRDGRVWLWAVPDPAPAVRVATRIGVAPDIPGVLAAQAEPGFDVATDTVLVRGMGAAGDAPPVVGHGAAAAPARVVSVESRPTRLVAEVETAAPAVLVWSRTFFPVWRATVDGAAAPVVVADGHLVGVPVPAGHHRVEVRWPAAPFAWGGGAALLGLVILVLLRR